MGMFINTSKIQFESKSQLNCCFGASIYRCLSIRQRYNLKANHNAGRRIQAGTQMFINTSKIQFESKSQHVLEVVTNFSDVYQYVKDTI